MRNGIFLVLFCVLLLALSSAILCSQDLSPTPPSNSQQLTPQQRSQIAASLELLLTIKLLSLQLGDDLSTWPLQIQNLLLTLQQRDKDIASSQQDLAASEAARQQTQGELDKSQTAQTEQSQYFKDSSAAQERAQQVLNQELAKEQAHRLFTDYATWAALGFGGGAIAGEAVGKSLPSSAEGGGIGAASMLALKFFGDITHLW